MRDAAVPGKNQHAIPGEHVAKDVGIRKDGAQHERPGDDALPGHWALGDQVLTPEKRFADQRAGDPVCNRVHVLWLGEERTCSADGDERRSLGQDAADFTSRYAVTTQRIES